jgi:hypothetical protein
LVPDATPEEAKLVAQVTKATPTLSLAVPEMITEAAVVDMVPVEGEVMVKLGAVVSVAPPEPDPAVADCRVIAIDLEI